MSLPHHHSGKFVKNCPIVNSLWTVNTKYLFVFNCKAVRVPSVASCHWAKFSNQIQIVADHDKYFMFISPSIKQKPGLSQNICICIESEMSVICPLVHLSRSRLIIAIVNHRCLLKQCPGQHTAHIGTQATAATRKKLWWQRAMRTWRLPSLPPLLVSSIRLFVPADPWSCPPYPAEMVPMKPGSGSDDEPYHSPPSSPVQNRAEAWLVNSNNFLHLDQSQILGLATPHLWSQYPVPGAHHPLVWLHPPAVAITHTTRLTTEIWYWIDTIKFLAAIESFFVQFYCRFVFSLSANKHRD